MSFDLKAKVIFKLLRGGQLKCPSLRGQLWERHKAAPTIDRVHQPDEVNASQAGKIETAKVIIVNS